MGRSRYASSVIIDGTHYETWTDPTSYNFMGPDILDGIDTVDHVLKLGERLDILASIYYGDEELWWVIALVNRIQDPFSLAIGTRLRIPADARQVLSKVSR